MVNTADFTKRLEKILKEYELSAAGFAQKIDVGRATISHILSGRNKPSLDFALKVISAFPEVDLYWLLLGQGDFPKQATTDSPILSTPTPFEKTSSTQSKEKMAKEPIIAIPNTSKSIQKIVVFYTDHTFESFEN